MLSHDFQNYYNTNVIDRHDDIHNMCNCWSGFYNAMLTMPWLTESDIVSIHEEYEQYKMFDL
jgi:hypothetical protein